MYQQLLNPGAPTEADWEFYFRYEQPGQYLQSIADSLKNENRFFVDVRFQKLLFDLFSASRNEWMISTVLQQSNVLYRARIYKESDRMDRFEHSEKYIPFQGYDKEHSGPPPKEGATEGRANPAGISYLYAATDPETALKEIRVQSGEYVSVATVKIKQDIALADLASGWCGLEKETIRKTRWINHFVLSLGDYFEKPHSLSSGYYLCQYVSEYIKALGYGAVQFLASTVQNSSGPNGVNVTLFNSDSYEITSSVLYYVTGMAITTAPPIPKQIQ